MSKGSAPQRRRVINYDKDSFNDPVKAANFEKLVSEMPPIDIDVDNSSHCYLVDEHIRESLETCFPRPRNIKKKEFISDSTFALILHGHGLAKKCESMIDALTKPCCLPYSVFGLIMSPELNIVCVMGSIKNQTLLNIYILVTNAKSMFSLSRVLLPSRDLPALTWKPKV